MMIAIFINRSQFIHNAIARQSECSQIRFELVQFICEMISEFHHFSKAPLKAAFTFTLNLFWLACFGALLINETVKPL